MSSYPSPAAGGRPPTSHRRVERGPLLGARSSRLPRRPGRPGRLVGDRGSATVELAVLFPAFLLLVFGGVQAAEWYHVRSLCLAAADAGVQAGRTTGAGDAVANQAAADFLARAGGDTATDPAVSTAGSDAAVQRVEVTASVPRVVPLPGLKMRVTQSSRAAREVFTTAGRP